MAPGSRCMSGNTWGCHGHTAGLSWCHGSILGAGSSNKNIANADALTSVKERNLAKENGAIQANINDENMQDLDDQHPSEKDVVQP
ncbi:hypothetical protein TNCV_4978951 [Trichonephila clavipes]|nr:hypothetical protein TNCV_4978951 [Trichonephila clavipes]